MILQNITPLKILPENSALRLRATLDFTDDSGNKFIAGDEWLFEGASTYTPKKHHYLSTYHPRLILGCWRLRICTLFYPIVTN